MNEIGSDDWRDQIAFRDALRADAGLAQAYAQLKRNLAAQYPADRGAYLAGKSGFVRKVLEQRASS